MLNVRTRTDPDLRYRPLERVAGIDELDAALTAAIAELGPGDGPPFAIFHGAVNDATSSRLEVGVPDAERDREIVWPLR
jgi:hypothetical protein